jgi:hypothetical protein
MTTGLRDIGSLIALRRAAANTAVTAAGAGDNTLVTGVTLDRAAMGWPESAVVCIPYTATLSAAATLSIGYTVQEGQAANLSDAATLVTLPLTVVATGAGTIAGEVEVNVSLRGAGRYVRVNFTPDLSAGATDTAALSAVIAFGGANRVPA